MTSVPPSFQHPGPPPSRPELPAGIERPVEHDLPPLGVPVWSPFAVGLAAFVTVLAVQIVAASFIALAGGDIEDVTESDAGLIGGTLVLDATLVTFSVLIVRWLHARPSPAAFGLRIPEWRNALGWIIATYAGFWVVAIVVGLVVGDADEQDLVVDLKAEDSLVVLAAFGVMTCLVAPLAEEFFFRGFLFQVLRERVNLPVGIVVGGMAFGIVHLPGGDWIAALVLSLFGMALCALFVLTSSLLPCIMLHALHNSISFAVTKELPWWGFLLLIVASVATTLFIARLAAQPRSAPA